jgi:hypothetical protein
MSKDRVETIDAGEQQDEFMIDDLETNQEIKGGSLGIKATDVTLKRGIID